MSKDSREDKLTPEQRNKLQKDIGSLAAKISAVLQDHLEGNEDLRLLSVFGALAMSLADMLTTAPSPEYANAMLARFEHQTRTFLKHLNEKYSNSSPCKPNKGLH